MKILLTICVLSILLSVLGLFRIAELFTLFLLFGILLGILCVPLSIFFLKKAKDKTMLVMLTACCLAWGAVCLSGGLLGGGRFLMRFVIKKYYLHTYDRERVYFVFKDYVYLHFDGRINFKEDWRQILANSDWYIKLDTFKATEKGNSFLALNSSVLGRELNAIDGDAVLFFETGNKDMAVGTEEDFLSQNWGDDTYRFVILVNGRECKYYKTRGGSQYFNTKTQEMDYEPLKWQ